MDGLHFALLDIEKQINRPGYGVDMQRKTYLCLRILMSNFKTIRTMFTIQTNQSGTRSINVSEENLATIEKYGLFRHLIDSNGIVDESVLEKLRLNIRDLIASQEGNCKDLLDLCIDVIYHLSLIHI